MKPSYNPDQQGFDFGTGNMIQDVCSILDMNEFPDIEPEDVANKLRCRGEYAMTIYRKVQEIWERTVDEEIVKELRLLPNRDAMSTEMMAIVLAEPIGQIESDIRDAIKNLSKGLEQLELDRAA